ncbi:MAG: hypothetical protein M1445_18840 [Bacteroidetes bacterium]|nr:hypothetical protein [Bacteroidota bacterium]MCL6101547.1 hypothetical protein [Bacteroidota bacterium]
MGTNLLNLFPSYLTSELVAAPGYGYYGWPLAFNAACALLPAHPTLTFRYNLLQL